MSRKDIIISIGDIRKSNHVAGCVSEERKRE